MILKAAKSVPAALSLGYEPLLCRNPGCLCLSIQTEVYHREGTCAEQVVHAACGTESGKKFSPETAERRR